MKRLLLLLLTLAMLAALPVVAFAQDDDPLADAEALLEEGEFEDAVEAYTEILDGDEENVDALIGRSEAYIALGEERRALADARRAVTLAPDNPDAYIARGAALLATDIDAALEDFSEATRLDPEYAEAYLVLAQVYSALGQGSQALANYDAAIEIEPENADYVYARGLLHYNMGNLEEALADYDAAIEIDPDNADYYFSRAYVNFDLGNIDATIADDDRVIELEPDFASGYLNRGYHLWSDGEAERASEDYYQWLLLIENSRFELDPIEGNSETLELDMDEGWSYYVPFTAPASGAVNVEVFSPGGLVDPVVVILNDDGEPIFVDDDGGFGLAVNIED
ncbi:MAG: tetratricopeptide repeat protein, partial [Chloroflexota bacterium]